MFLELVNPLFYNLLTEILEIQSEYLNWTHRFLGLLAVILILLLSGHFHANWFLPKWQKVSVFSHICLISLSGCHLVISAMLFIVVAREMNRTENLRNKG